MAMSKRDIIVALVNGTGVSDNAVVKVVDAINQLNGNEKATLFGVPENIKAAVDKGAEALTEAEEPTSKPTKSSK